MIKSKYDNRKYKIITLKNNLEIMLISDINTDKSAISMNVGVGCFQDPDNIPGLAHFLEHMLFMGTQKYPDENDFSNYLSRNGGLYNAFTSLDKTNYHFEINPSGFKCALDKFAHFFIDPLFNKNSIDKEMNAIQSEYSKNLQNDMRRIFSILRILSKKNHPMNKFCTGTLETLKEIPKKQKIDIYEQVLLFYKKWYSSNIMKLVVLDKNSLSDMEKMVQIFSKIENKNVKFPINKTDPYCNNLNRIIINPINNIDKINIIWSINSNEQEYFRSLLYFICEMLNYRGDDSFISMLKKLGYIHNFNLDYINYDNLSYYFVYLNINLTKKGLQNREKVLDMVYEFFNYINSLDETMFKNIFNNMMDIAVLNFMFKQNEDPLDYVMEISQNMEIYPEKYYLSGDVLMRKFKFSLIKQILKDINMNKAIHLIISKDVFALNNNKIKKEYYYGTEYIELPERKFSNIISKNISKNIKFPEKNNFIPRNLSIKCFNKKNKYPIKLLSNKLSEVWYKRDTTFKQPYTYLYMELVTPIANKDVKNNILNTLLVNIWNDILGEKLYLANIIGYYIKIYPTMEGLIININGYNDKFKNLFKDLLEEIVNGEINCNLFNIHKEALDKYYKNIQYQSPIRQAYLMVRENIISNIIHSDDKKKEIKNITYDDLINYKKELFSNLYIKYMFYGNIQKVEINSILNIVKKNINYKKITYYPKYKILKLKDKRIIYSSKSSNRKENDSAVVLLYQIGKLKHKLYLITEVLQSIINEPFFDQLRTNEQLGYIVSTNIIYLNKTVNLVFEIQSSVKGPTFLLERIDHFLINFKDKLLKMSDLQFKSFIDSVIEIKKMKFINMDEEFSYNYSEIKIKEYLFNRYEIDIKYLNKIHKNDIIELYNKFIVNNTRNLVVKISGKSDN